MSDSCMSEIGNGSFELPTAICLDSFVSCRVPGEVDQCLGRLLGIFGGSRINCKQSCPNIIDNQLIERPFETFESSSVGVGVISCDQVAKGCSLIPHVMLPSVLPVYGLGTHTKLTVRVLWLVSECVLN